MGRDTAIRSITGVNQALLNSGSFSKAGHSLTLFSNFYLAQHTDFGLLPPEDCENIPHCSVLKYPLSPSCLVPGKTLRELATMTLPQGLPLHLLWPAVADPLS